MNRFRRKGPTALEVARENELKLNLTKEFSAAIRNLQQENLHSADPILSTEPANAVCNVLEAIFLHGCKAPVSRKIANYMGIIQGNENGFQPLDRERLLRHSRAQYQKGNIERLICENFWQFVEQFTHSDVTAQLKRLGQITTEIGLSRAWIRVALNDGLMASYVDAIVSDKKILEYYYHRTAYFRDHEQPEILKSYLKGLMTFEFHLSYNSSILNSWSNVPLTLAGVINADDTPLPVIHPAKATPSTGDKKPHNGTTERSSVGRELKPEDGDDSIVLTNKSKKHSKNNSLLPSRTSEITQISSELTRSDVDEIRGMKSKYRAPSECSDSSRVSCPDSIKINRNPASYVDLKLPDEPIFDLHEDIDEGEERNSDIRNYIQDQNSNIADTNSDKDIQNHAIADVINQSVQGEIIQHSKAQLSFPREVNGANVCVTEADKTNLSVESYISGYNICNTTSDLVEEIKTQEKLRYDIQDNKSTPDKNQDSNTIDIVNTRILDEILKEEVTDLREEECTDGAKQNVSPSSQPKSQHPKTKHRSKKERLRPELSPTQKHVAEPELSPAVANAIETTKMDITARERFSLPDIQEALYSSSPGRPRSGALSVSGSSDSRNFINSSSHHEEEVGVSSPQSYGNSLGARSGWSSQFDLEADESNPYTSVQSPQYNDSIPVRRNKAESFGSLLQNYKPSSPVASKSVDDVIQELPDSDFSSPASPRLVMTQHQESQEDFEIVAKTCLNTEKLDAALKDSLDKIAMFCECVPMDLPSTITQNQMSLLGEIAQEKGLDTQNYQCGGCKRPIGLIYGKPRLCTFDGKYYCFECHENDEYYIPAYIVHNWDFRKHLVSKKSLQFLQEVEDQSLIDLSGVNPKLYEHVKEMEDIHVLRRQLCHLKTYLFTCKQSVADEFRKSVWPKDYQYDGEHTYTLADLLQIPAGHLAQSLRKVIRFASKHVYGCPLCSGKGFICELCHSSKVIYPFEVDNTIRCSSCKSVFHKQCKTEAKACPKCARRQKRRTKSDECLETPDMHDYAYSPIL